jgi:hypothetical protein
MDGTLEERLAAVERVVTDGDHDCAALAEGAATADRVAELESDIEELTDRVAELEAATQALRGYVGNVRSVNDEVEQRADTALETARAARRAVEGTGPQEDSGDPAGADTDDPGPTDGTRRSDSPGGYCDNCDRPLGTDAPDSGSRLAETGPASLGGLREDTRAVRSGPGGIATQTDGGLDRPDDGDGGPGFVARIRDLI